MEQSSGDRKSVLRSIKTQSLAVFCLLCALPAFSNYCESDSRTVLSISESIFERIIDTHPRLPKEKQRELLERYAQNRDRETADEIIRHNLRLVSKIASRYEKYFEGDRMDYIQAGNIGLFEAIKRYDLEKGFEFHTYAYPYIEGYIKNHFHKNLRLVRIKVEAGKQKRFMVLKDKLRSQGKNVFDERKWLAKEIGIEVDMVIAMDFQLRKNNKMNLDEPVKDGMTLAEVFPDRKSPFVRGILRTDPIFKKHLVKFLKNYPKRNRDIFLKYNFASISSKELAEVYGISSERVRQINKSIVNDLKKYVDSFGLR